MTNENETLRTTLATVRKTHNKIVMDLETKHSDEIAEFQFRLNEAEEKIKKLEQQKKYQNFGYSGSDLVGGLGYSPEEFE